jgi:hypothetical protein
MKHNLLFSAVVALLTGCSTAKVSPVSVGHSPIGAVENKKKRNGFSKTFVLARKQDPKFSKMVGSVPWAGGPGLNWYFVSSDPLGIAIQTTEFFSEALNTAGYKTILEAPGSSSGEKSAMATLQGEIREFWLYGGAGGVDGKITIALTLRSPDGKNVLWQKEFSSVRKKGMAFANYQTWGNESAKVVREALDDVLSQAVKEFASDDFYGNVKTQ